MEQHLSPDMLDKLTKVCICKGISRAAIKAALNNGAETLEAVQEATGAGTGSCGGKRCTPKILELLSQQKAEI
jgi:NAD(P)H-nitrite reductase large subunit